MVSISTTAMLIHIVMLFHGDINEAADTYTVTKEICCNYKVYNQNSKFTMQCCGDESFDNEESICCNGQVVSRPNGTLETPFGNEPQFKCCHDVVYDITQQICCGKKLWDVPKNDKTYNHLCCDDDVYNINTHRCCDGQVQPNSGMQNPGCCGSDIIDFSFASCCFDNNVERRYIHDWLVPLEYTWLHPHISTWVRPQYNAWVHPHTSVNKNCCNRNASEDETTGSVLKNYVRCCGEQILDVQSQLCCGNTIIQRSDSSSLEGCCGERIYNAKTQVCCGEIIYDKVSDDTRCCGNTTFEQVNQICCENKVIPVDELKTSRCCKREPFKVEVRV